MEFFCLLCLFRSLSLVDLDPAAELLILVANELDQFVVAQNALIDAA
jgi:hypothetical protein